MAAIPVNSAIMSFVLFIFYISLAASSSSEDLERLQPKNIEVFYPLFLSSPSPGTTSLERENPSLSPLTSSKSNRREIVRAVLITAFSTLIFAGILFFLLAKFIAAHRHRRHFPLKKKENSYRNRYNFVVVASGKDLAVQNHSLKNMVVDENGLDVFYWRNLEKDSMTSSLLAQSHRSDSNRITSLKAPFPSPQISKERHYSQHFTGPLPNKQVHTTRSMSKTVPVMAKRSDSVIKSAQSLSSKSNTVKSTGENPLNPLDREATIKKRQDSIAADMIGDKSIRFDGDIIEAMFGYVADNRGRSDISAADTATAAAATYLPKEIILLEPNRSKEIAAILRSLALTRQEILDSLLNGRELDSESLKKLAKISPTKEEEIKIINFTGDPMKLADAESFLFHLHRNIPSPFRRLECLLFKSSFRKEVDRIKQFIQTLELACMELENHNFLLKLLKDVLRATNPINDDRTIEISQVFNLSSLQNLSNSKSDDGETNLLHFVIEEVLMSEGKSCIWSQNLRNSNTDSSNMEKKDREEYIRHGLSITRGIIAKYANLKKAVSIKNEELIDLFLEQTSHINRIYNLLKECNDDSRGRFVAEMNKFVREATEDLRKRHQEHIRAIDLVKKTTDYYLGKDIKDRDNQPFQLFVLMNEFLKIVDEVCINIARNLQNKRGEATSNVSSSCEDRTDEGFLIDD